MQMMGSPSSGDTSERLARVVLTRGSHLSREDGLCLAEAVAWIAGEPHTAYPECMSPVLRVVGDSLNDDLPDNRRQRLVPLIPDLIGTAGDGHDETRSYLALDWLLRGWLPAWLDLVPSCRGVAARLRELEPVVDPSSARRAAPTVRDARVHAGAAWDEVRSTVPIAVADAVASAAWDVVRATAWDVTWVATVVAASPPAAVAAAWYAAASTTLRVAVRAASAGDAPAFAETAIIDAETAAMEAAAEAAAEAALQPTVTAFQESAIELYQRMIHPTGTD